MKGEYTISGVTPLKIPYVLQGIYKIKSSRHGYENWSSIYDFSGEVLKKVSFNLKPKSRFKAGLRSFFFPGWGQYYSDRKIQSLVLGWMEITSVLFTVKKTSDYNRIVNDYKNLVDEYKSTSMTFNKRQSLKDQIKTYEIKADDAYQKKQMWLYIMASVWTYNILDAVFFFGFDKISTSSEMFPSISALSEGEKIGINLKWYF